MGTSLRVSGIRQVRWPVKACSIHPCCTEGGNSFAVHPPTEVSRRLRRWRAATRSRDRRCRAAVKSPMGVLVKLARQRVGGWLARRTSPGVRGQPPAASPCTAAPTVPKAAAISLKRVARTVIDVMRTPTEPVGTPSRTGTRPTADRGRDHRVPQALASTATSRNYSE